MTINDVADEIKRRFEGSFEGALERILREIPNVGARVESSFGGQLVNNPYYLLALDCILLGAPAEGTDNVALCISGRNYEGRIGVEVEIIWGHPSGITEIELFDPPAEPVESTFQIIENNLPLLFEKLIAILRLGHPSDEPNIREGAT